MGMALLLPLQTAGWEHPGSGRLRGSALHLAGESPARQHNPVTGLHGGSMACFTVTTAGGQLTVLLPTLSRERGQHPKIGQGPTPICRGRLEGVCWLGAGRLRS